MREDQFAKLLTYVEMRFDQLDVRLAQLDQRFDQLERIGEVYTTQLDAQFAQYMKVVRGGNRQQATAEPTRNAHMTFNEVDL